MKVDIPANYSRALCKSSTSQEVHLPHFFETFYNPHVNHLTEPYFQEHFAYDRCEDSCLKSNLLHCCNFKSQTVKTNIVVIDQYYVLFLVHDHSPQSLPCHSTTGRLIDITSNAEVDFPTKSVFRIYIWLRFQPHRTSDRSISFTNALSAPIPSAGLADVRMRVTIDRRPPYLKGGQLMSSMLEAINELWLRLDSDNLRYPVTYSTAAFPNIAILISPTHIQKLTPVIMAFGLSGTATSILTANRNHWPGGVIVTITDIPSAQTLGNIHIWDDTLPRNALLSLNKTLALATTPFFTDSSITTTTGPGIADNSTCTTACSPLTADPPSPISDTDWLSAFMQVMSHAFTHYSYETVAAQFHGIGQKSWTALTENGRVRCRILFNDRALDPAAPLTLAGFVEGMLALLREWAQGDVWREGSGEIKLRGRRVATVQVSRVRAEVGTGEGVATA